MSACNFYSWDVKKKTIGKEQASFCLTLTLNNLRNCGLCVFLYAAKMEQHFYYCWEQSNKKTRNKLFEWKAFWIQWELLSANLTVNFFLILISMNQIAKVDCNAFLSESESFVPFWRRFHFSSLDCKRLWSACLRQNQSDFCQFSWSPTFSDRIFRTEFKVLTPMADFLFLTLKSRFYSCLAPANIAVTNFGKPPHHKGKKPMLLFLLVKNFFYDFWLVRCLYLTCKENHPTNQNLGRLLQIIYIFFYLAWSKSQYVYDRLTYKHISKSLVLVKP